MHSEKAFQAYEDGEGCILNTVIAWRGEKRAGFLYQKSQYINVGSVSLRSHLDGF